MLLALGKASSIIYSNMLLLHCRLTCHKDEVFYYYYMFVYLYYTICYLYLYLGLLPAKDSSGNERGLKQLPNGGPAIAACDYNKYICSILYYNTKV